MNDATANFTGFPAGYSPFSTMAQALGYQQPGTPVQFPQMAPQQMGYGPMHSALAQALADALRVQSTGGLLGSPTPDQMGLLSTAITPTQAVNMPSSGTGAALNPNQYWRLSQEFWNGVPNKIGGGSEKAVSYSPATNTREIVRYTGEPPAGSWSPIGPNGVFRTGAVSNGYSSGGGAYGDAGGGLSTSGQRDLSSYGGIF